MAKRIFEVAIGFLLFVAVCHSQFIRGYGFKAGGVTSNEKWDYTADFGLGTDHRWGFTASCFVEFLNIPALSIVGEIQYTQKGMKVSVGETSPESPDIIRWLSVSPRVDYLAIPVFLKVRFPLFIAEPYILAGPRYDILIARSTDGFGLVIDKFRTSDIGGTIGAGVEVKPLTPFSLLAEFRYNADFADTYKTDLLRVRNRSFDFLVGIRF